MALGILNTKIKMRYDFDFAQVGGHPIGIEK